MSGDTNSKTDYNQSIVIMTNMIQDMTYAYIHGNLTEKQIKDINFALRSLVKKVPSWSDTFRCKRDRESYIIAISEGKEKRGK